MIDYRQIESRSVDLLLALERATVPIDIVEATRQLRIEQAKYASIKMDIAKETGKYIQDLDYSYDGYLADRKTPYRLRRAYMCGYMLNRLIGQVELNRLSGKAMSDEVSIRYHFQEDGNRIIPTGEIRHVYWPQRFRSCVVAPPGKKLVVAGFDFLDVQVLAHLSGDPQLKDDCRNNLFPCSLAIFGQADTRSYLRLTKALFYPLICGGDAVDCIQIMEDICEEDQVGKELRVEFDELFKRFTQRYIMMIGYLDELHTNAIVGTITGRTLRYPQNVMSIMTTATDVSKHAICNLTEDKNLKRYNLTPHLLNMDILVSSVDENADEEELLPLIRQNLDYPDVPDLIPFISFGPDWHTCSENSWRSCLEHFQSERN